MSSYRVIGLMSGSSLDGLDVCDVIFTEVENTWRYEIQHTEGYAYVEDFQNALRRLPESSAYELAEMHTRFSRIQAQYLQLFFQKYPDALQAECIVSHGQTIFHQPEKSFTTQIGCGATLAALTNRTVVCDLRTYDVALGGQGAPLVPFGEKYLFPEYQYFLNIGGISNIAIHNEDGVTAFDICPGNTLLNLLAQKKGLPFDKDGQVAQSGKVFPALLLQLSEVEFYQKNGPKSLGTEHLMRDWWPKIENASISIEDKMATVVEHIAIEIAKFLSNKTTLVTGGGASNTFLVERLKANQIDVIIPSRETIEYKEALIIAFVGLMRKLGRNNFISSVTGSSRDNMGGAIYG